MPFWLIRPIAWLTLQIGYFLLGGIRFEGREHVPLRGGVLITPNHISDADPPTIALAMPRACWFMAKEEIFAMPILGLLTRWLHGFPVKRNTADRSALRKTESLLKQGEAVVIFPEGRISRDGRLQPLLPGALLVARRANTPIVPAIILGTDRLMPYGKLWPRPAGKPIIVRFGPPVTMMQLTGGLTGSEGHTKGAERLGAIMLALQQGQSYPQFNDEEDSVLGLTGGSEPSEGLPQQQCRQEACSSHVSHY